MPAVTASQWADSATAIAAIAAAVAAVAAWATVYMEHRWRRREREPLLTIGVGSVLDEGRRIRVIVENSGGGVAREVYFWVREGNQVCFGGLPPTGTLGPGRRVVLATALTPTRSTVTEAAVQCYFGKYVLAWDAAARHQRLNRNRRWVKKLSRGGTFDRWFPGAGALKETLVASGLESES